MVVRNPLQIKLGSSRSRGFYSIDVEKEYTEIQKGKMPYLVLSLLSESPLRIGLGFNILTLSDRLIDIRPDLATDEYGYSSTLPSLLKDFAKGKLVTYNRSSVKITELGLQFLKHNVKEV